MNRNLFDGGFHPYDLFIACVLLLAGCSGTVEGTVSASDRGMCVECRDTKTGERFSFRAADIFNARVGFGGADSSFEVQCSDGVVRTLRESENNRRDCIKHTCEGSK